LRRFASRLRIGATSAACKHRDSIKPDT